MGEALVCKELAGQFLFLTLPEGQAHPPPIAACPSRFSLARTKPRLFRAGKASQEARVACERRPFVDAFLECSPFECRGPCLARRPPPPLPYAPGSAPIAEAVPRTICGHGHLFPPFLIKTLASSHRRLASLLLIAAEAFHCRASSPFSGAMT